MTSELTLFILVDYRLITSHDVIDLKYMGRSRRFKVKRIHSNDPNASVFAISSATKISIDDQQTDEDVEMQQDDTKAITYDRIGGLAEQIKTVREMVETPLRNPELFYQYGNKRKSKGAFSGIERYF